ncbi:hypothetical protein GCM10011583_19460 [Streptomyces camponoticapitis]|uniref:Secreted protein n=1 Tax=Streptomyces camponoticapitis TaxID=1616125 RepID=A0ABQ2E1R1_9ACTN|nr:hypothetical protein [Streptomyces camponoticapitis]GGJ88113.1 hypothetical protein GCM10011583_19460 [Streptomyces camponoticapitis]
MSATVVAALVTASVAPGRGPERPGAASPPTPSRAEESDDAVEDVVEVAGLADAGVGDMARRPFKVR